MSKFNKLYEELMEVKGLSVTKGGKPLDASKYKVDVVAKTFISKSQGITVTADSNFEGWSFNVGAKTTLNVGNHCEIDGGLECVINTGNYCK